MVPGLKHIALHVSKNFKPRVEWTIDSQTLPLHKQKASWVATLTFELSPQLSVDASRYWFKIKGSLDYDDETPRIADNLVLDPFHLMAFAKKRGQFWGVIEHDPQKAMDARQLPYWVATVECHVQQVFFANHAFALRRAIITTADRSVNVEPQVRAA